MVPWYHSIITKLTVAFVILIFVIAGLSVFYTFGATKTALKETTRDELVALASVVATQIDGDILASLQPGDEETPGFIKIRDQLYAMQSSNSEILYLYTMRQTSEGFVFVVDGEYGIINDAAGIGELYETPTDEMETGLTVSVAEKEYMTDQWGTVISGYAPVKNAAGVVTGIVGVDMSAERVIERQDFIGSIIYLIMLIGIGITAVIIGIISKTMIRDIRALNDSAEKISTGDTNVLVTVVRNDEIGELASSFSRMVSSLKIMMMDEEP